MPTWINVKKDTNVVIDGNLAYYDENLHSFIRYVYINPKFIRLEKSVMIRIKLNKTTDEVNYDNIIIVLVLEPRIHLG